MNDFEKSKSRDVFPLECKHCKKQFLRAKNRIQLALNKNNTIRLTLDFCSSKCNAQDKIKQVQVSCDTCKKSVMKHSSQLKKSKHGVYFCSKSCSAIYNNAKYRHKSEEITKFTYREKAFLKLPNKCNSCGYANINILQVHHKDSNRNNNEINNLEILCPNCHTEKHYLESTGQFSKTKNFKSPVKLNILI